MSAVAAALGSVVPSAPKKPLKSYSRVQYMAEKNRANLLRNSQNVAYMFENNENVERFNVVPNFTPEAPRSVIAAGLKTPNRPTRIPWGKPGFLPSNAPPRRGNHSRKNRSNRSRKNSRSRH